MNFFICLKSRKCGKSVCELCSQKKINDNRVCDKCFIKVNHRKVIISIIKVGK